MDPHVRVGEYSKYSIDGAFEYCSPSVNNLRPRVKAPSPPPVQIALKSNIDHHLEHIGNVMKSITCQIHNLWQLQTLDMKDTCVCNMPKTITNLRTLQYPFAEGWSPRCVNSNERLPHDLAKLCGACCAPWLLRDVKSIHGDPNLHDVCTFWRYICCVPYFGIEEIRPIWCYNAKRA